MLGERGYEVLRELGQGSFGQALLVRRADCNLHFVAKVQPYSHLSEMDKVALSREVKHMHLLSTYHHPHLVRFRQSFQNEQELFIIMDYYEEPDLALQIQAQRRAGIPFEEADVKRWLYEIISGLDYLHFCRFLHRDIKPSNIFMSRGSALLGDLGMSKEVSTGVTGIHLHTQCGSPLYIAPEVHMGQPYSKSVDVWSLGCTLFEVRTSPLPYHSHRLHTVLTCPSRIAPSPLVRS
jgi:NIMA (never in mitosis gene a)-related kinase